MEKSGDVQQMEVCRFLERHKFHGGTLLSIALDPREPRPLGLPSERLGWQAEHGLWGFRLGLNSQTVLQSKLPVSSRTQFS